MLFVALTYLLIVLITATLSTLWVSVVVSLVAGLCPSQPSIAFFLSKSHLSAVPGDDSCDFRRYLIFESISE